MRNLDVWVISCYKYSDLLPEFLERFQMYWGDDVNIFVSREPMERWSNGVLKLAGKIKTRYFILMHEDFFITKHVDLNALDDAVKFISQRKIARFSLVGNHTPERTIKHGNFYMHKKDEPYMLSFEASIFNRDFINNYVGFDEDAWEAERMGSKRTLGKDEFVLYTENPIVEYKDAMRRGERQKV